MGTKNYYEIIAKCGHVGRKHYVPIKFAVIAEDAILNVKKISYERYLEIVEANHNDQYLNCHSKHEQKLINNFEERLEDDFNNLEIKYDKQARIDRVSYKLKKFKNLEKISWKESFYVHAY